MTVRYALDPEQSRFTVQAFAGGMLSMLAHNPIIAIRDFTGEIRFTPGALEDAALEMTVRADSLAATDNVKQQDRQEIENRMRTEVLETSKYPEINFQTKAVSSDRIAEGWYRLQFQGELTLHGVTRIQTLDTQLRIPEDGVRLSGEFRLLLSAYKIRPVSALGGTIKLKDEVKFAFDLTGRPTTL